MIYHRYSLAGLFCISMMAHGAEDPIAWKIISETLPTQSSLYSIYHTTYQFTSNLPFVMPSPLIIHAEMSSDEFSIADQCSYVYLYPGESCNVTVELNPDESGKKAAGLKMSYASTVIPLPVLETQTAESWTGAIGVDYNPNHYPVEILLNNHDVFYVGSNAASQPITNVYAELAQLQAAGFNLVRSYQTVEYSWIDMINQANALGVNVVYEAVIPQSGGQADITAAVTVLTNVINAVGATVFQNTVSLVFAGHENYNNSNITYLTNAVSALQAQLTASNITTPVGSAVVSGDLTTPDSAVAADMQTLINSYSATAPLGFDPYPFQWGVPVASAVSIASPPQLQNSIAWDYEQVMAQSFYVNPRPILMAETGWATQGTNSGYYCYNNPTNPCEASEANAATYLSALYTYVRDTSNLSGALVFEAYDEPAKDPSNPDDAENFYGVFDSNCNLKNNDTTLLPNTAYSPTANLGCQGFVEGALFVVVGDPSVQPPFTVQIAQTSPVAGQNASMTVNVPTQNRNLINIYPWPNFLVFNNASITLTGSASGTVCTLTASVSSAIPPILSLPATPSCNGAPAFQVNCSGNNCFLPANF